MLIGGGDLADLCIFALGIKLARFSDMLLTQQSSGQRPHALLTPICSGMRCLTIAN